MEIGKRNKIIYPFRLLISPMSLRWPSNVLFRATRLAIGGKRVMARVSHIEKPQSPELQGFGEGDKFLSFLLVGSNSGVSGKTQNPVVAIPYRFDPGHRHHNKRPSAFVGGLLLCLPCRYCFPFIVKTDDKIPLFCYTYTK